MSSKKTGLSKEDEQIYLEFKKRKDKKRLMLFEQACITYKESHPQFCDEDGVLLTFSDLLYRDKKNQLVYKPIIIINPITNQEEEYDIGYALKYYKGEYQKLKRGEKPATLISEDDWKELLKIVSLDGYTPLKKAITSFEEYKKQNKDKFDESGRLQTFVNVDFTYYNTFLQQEVSCDIRGLLHFYRKAYREYKSGKPLIVFGEDILKKDWEKLGSLIYFENELNKKLYDKKREQIIDFLKEAIDEYRYLNSEAFDETGRLAVLPPKSFVILRYDEKKDKYIRYNLNKQITNFKIAYSKHINGEPHTYNFSDKQWQRLSKMIYLTNDGQLKEEGECDKEDKENKVCSTKQKEETKKSDATPKY